MINRTAMIEQLEAALEFAVTYPEEITKTLEMLLTDKGFPGTSVEPVIKYIIENQDKFKKILAYLAEVMTDQKLDTAEAKKLVKLVMKGFGKTIDPSDAWDLTAMTAFNGDNAKLRLFRLARTIQELG